MHKINITKIIAAMSLHEKVGQLIMPFAFGTFFNEESVDFKRIKRLITDYKVGGFCLFKGTTYGYAHLISRMQKLADIPLLISADFERGLGMRIVDAVEFPFNMGVGATNDSLYAFKMAEQISREMRLLGVHQNYAPVADINLNVNNPIVNLRGYSEDKNKVADFCVKFIEGCKKHRILSTVKHFPGHGNTDIDSHVDLSVIYSNDKELWDVDIYPFVKCIEAGVSSVMIAHVAYPNLENRLDIPVTLSNLFVEEYLRNRLGFKGLVVTDAFTMYGITNYFSIADAVVSSVKAGVDIVLMPPDEEVAINSLLDAVKQGELSEARINESVRRILEGKLWAGAFNNKGIDFNRIDKGVNSKKTYLLAKEISKKAVTIVRDKKNLLPIDFTRKVSCVTFADNIANDQEKMFQTFLSNKTKLFMTYLLDEKSVKKDYKMASLLVDKSDVIVLSTFIRIRAFQGAININQKFMKFMDKLVKQRKKIVVISFGDPYLDRKIDGLDTYITAFGDSVLVQETVAELLTSTCS